MSDDAPKFREPMPPPVRRSGRLGPSPLNHFQALARVGPNPLLGRAALIVPAVRRWEKVYGKLPDSQLQTAADALRGRVRARERGRGLIAEAFGLCSVAVWRVMGYRPYDVQLVAGLLMQDGRLVELATGEGKTLTAIFPSFLMALAGKGCHVATVNDYLAKRDAEEVVGPVHRLLGLTVGVLQQKMEDAARVEAYKADITYATASEFGFDYLRDRIKQRGGQGVNPPFWSAWLDPKGKPLDPRVQRDLYSVIVDEADSIFIDEARTPLIISGPIHEANEEEAVPYKWADGVVREMKEGEHFTVDLKKDKVEMTLVGRHHVRYSQPPSGPFAKALDKLFEQVEKSLQAHYRFTRDQHYMISEKDNKVVIIDENTGRPMPDRVWRDGLHQAVEAKEGVPINVAGDPAASITFQSFFKQYERVAGMSGTIIQNRRELKRVYGLKTVAVPTNRPTIRTRWPDKVFPTEGKKFDAIVEEIGRLVGKGRPVLVGTRTVDKSEALSEKLKAAGIGHEVLNARFHETEAKIVEGAGQAGRVTVATNMAGRGTDIKLGPGVREAGGLHVVSTELNEAVRIDRQLLGRAGRQGDPGSGQVFVSLDDNLLEALGMAKQEAITQIGLGGGSRDWTAYRRLFRLAQRKTERKHYRQRLDLMHHEKQRREMLAELGADPFVD